MRNREHRPAMSTLACVAVLSDIHGVLPALCAVLAEPAVATAEPLTKVTAVVCGHTDMPFTACSTAGW